MAEDVRHGSGGPVEFTHRINAKNAKILAVIVVLGLVVYHGIIHLTYGIDSCKWLLSDGRFQGYRVWQPYGCMMHSYSNEESRMCMRYIAYWGGYNYVVFLGDSRIRQQYFSFVQKLSPNHDYKPEDKYAHRDLNHTEKDLNLKVEFLWHPMINHSMYRVYDRWLSLPPNERPSVVITGSGTWSIKTSNASLDALDSFINNMTRLVPYMDRLHNTSKVLWVLQDPVVPEKLDASHLMISNEQIDLYNKAAMDILKYSSVTIWKSSRLVSQGYNSDQIDGLHVGDVVLNYAVQILMNMYCNDHMNYNDGSCCSSAEPVTKLQIISFSIFGVFIVLAAAMVVHRKWILRHNYLRQNCDITAYESSKPDEKSWYELSSSLAVLGLIMGYMFLCDRTNFFMKENKYFTNLNFFLPFAYVFALGIFFTEESQHTQVLHRDQTDEWKGWMQLVILIYHMTGASEVLPIYMHIRVLVAAYLFLNGFGHFTYFWHRGDHGFYRLWQSGFQHFPYYWAAHGNGLRRVLEVLFRLNFLAVVMCLCMNRPYQFYYFVPLVSFWFIVLYVTLVTVPQVTSTSSEANHIHYLYVVLKFVAIFSIVTVLYLSEVFFEKIFVTRPWKALFVTTDDSIKEWWFRWKIDRYSVATGMLFAFAYYLMKQYRIIDDHNHSNLFSKGLALSATLASVVGLMIYAGFAFLCRNKPECTEVHPYLSFLPILSYIVLRNITGLLRTRYSTFFAWFGKISLELFVGQCHIWLAADTHGVLVLVPSYPVLNVIVTSFIFICAAHEVNLLTKKLLKYAIPTDWRYLGANIGIFFLVLIPIGIHDGMF